MYQLYLRFGGWTEGGRGKDERGKCSWEEQSRSENQRPRWFPVCTTGTTGPGKTGEHKKRAKRESWKRSVAAREEDKEVVLLYCWCKMLDRGTCRHYELVSPFRGSLSSLGTRVNHVTRGGTGVTKYLCTDVERPGNVWGTLKAELSFFLWLVRFLKAARQCQSRGSLLRESGLLRVLMSGIFSSANDRVVFWYPSVFGVCSDR